MPVSIILLLCVSDGSANKLHSHHYQFSLITIPPVAMATIISKGVLLLFRTLLPSHDPSPQTFKDQVYASTSQKASGVGQKEY